VKFSCARESLLSLFLKKRGSQILSLKGFSVSSSQEKVEDRETKVKTSQYQVWMETCSLGAMECHARVPDAPCKINRRDLCRLRVCREVFGGAEPDGPILFSRSFLK